MAATDLGSGTNDGEFSSSAAQASENTPNMALSLDPDPQKALPTISCGLPEARDLCQASAPEVANRIELEQAFHTSQITGPPKRIQRKAASRRRSMMF